MPNSYILLQDAFKRSKELGDGRTYVPTKLNAKRVLSPQQEDHIAAYAIRIAKMFYGLPVPDFRRLVYQYAVACNSTAIPDVWEEKGMATRDWYYAYMTRHPNLTLKAPEGMAIARAIAFNRANVEVFFNAYAEAMTRHQFSPDRIFNMDESSLSTVMKPMKVVCQRGQPVASQVSTERGLSMTFVGFINAAGHYIPPAFIIPRKRWNDAFMRGTLHGSKGILHHNGWMDGECFLETLQHLKASTFCSPENKVLLIMDNAECHLSIHAVEYACENGIVIVTLPPHTTAKLQPLDVSIYGPFKSHLKSLQNDFRLMNPHTHITLQMLPEFACKAWVKAANPTNVMSGFAATGIWPINRNIFPDEAFAGAEVTEREQPPVTAEEVSPTSSAVGEEEALPHSLESSPSSSPGPSQVAGSSSTSGDPAFAPGVASSSSAQPGPSTSCQDEPATPPPLVIDEPATPPPLVIDEEEESATLPSLATATPPPLVTITPESIRPFPKAKARPLAKGRKQVKACILTEDEEAKAHLRAKAEKKKMVLERKKNAEARKIAAIEKKILALQMQKEKYQEMQRKAEAAEKKEEEKKRKAEGTGKKEEEKKRKAEAMERKDEGKKRKAVEKKSTGPAKKKVVVEKDSSEEEVELIQLNDSSEYSDEVQEEVNAPDKYPYMEKEPAVRDFIFLNCFTYFN